MYSIYLLQSEVCVKFQSAGDSLLVERIPDLGTERGPPAKDADLRVGRADVSGEHSW